jgi:hypothetical protein
MRYTQAWSLLDPLQQWATWVEQGILTSCVFFNMGVFYHPPGVFYTMGCYKLPKMLSKKKHYATRPFSFPFPIRP